VNALAPLARAGLRLFFDHIEIEGMQHVPMDGPLLVVSNHTNGLVDGLMLLDILPRPALLTAKSTLSKNPLLALLMRVGGVVPIYRKQDAVDVSRNADSFAAIRARLTAGEAVCIFPEGVSHSDAALRQIKSGAARIALGIPGLRILPVGLHYHAKQRLRSSVLVRIGAPIEAAADDDVHSLTARIEDEIRALTANFSSVREALWLRWTAELLATRGEDPRPLDQESVPVAERAALLDALRADYERASSDSEGRARIAALYASLRAYRRDLRRLGIAQHEVYLSMHPAQAAFFVLRELELLVAGAAIVLAGLVQHGLAFAADRLLTRKLSVDLDQFASNAIFYGYVLFSLTGLIGIALAWTLGSPWIAAVYTLLLPFTLLYLVLWQDRAARMLRRARTFFRFLIHRGLQRDLQQRGRALIAQIQEARS
jgi:glycerol-3-phosphate O-acyltransferase/dihydroxyacetone phosphate acyltransferase